MDNIVGYICSTPWGTVSRTTPSLGWTPVLPAIPDGGRTPAPAQPPPDSASSCGPARVSPPSFPRCRARSWRPSTPQTRSPDAGASAGTTPARAGRCGGESPLRLRSSGSCSTPGLAWDALADYCLEHSDELDELAHTGTAWAGYPSDWAGGASDELMDELLGVLL